MRIRLFLLLSFLNISAQAHLDIDKLEGEIKKSGWTEADAFVNGGKTNPLLDKKFFNDIWKGDNNKKPTDNEILKDTLPLLNSSGAYERLSKVALLEFMIYFYSGNVQGYKFGSAKASSTPGKPAQIFEVLQMAGVMAGFADLNEDKKRNEWIANLYTKDDSKNAAINDHLKNCIDVINVGIQQGHSVKKLNRNLENAYSEFQNNSFLKNNRDCFNIIDEKKQLKQPELNVYPNIEELVEGGLIDEHLKNNLKGLFKAVNDMSKMADFLEKEANNLKDPINVVTEFEYRWKRFTYYLEGNDKIKEFLINVPFFVASHLLDQNKIFNSEEKAQNFFKAVLACKNPVDVFLMIYNVRSSKDLMELLEDDKELDFKIAFEDYNFIVKTYFPNSEDKNQDLLNSVESLYHSSKIKTLSEYLDLLVEAKKKIFGEKRIIFK